MLYFPRVFTYILLLYFLLTVIVNNVYTAPIPIRTSKKSTLTHASSTKNPSPTIVKNINKKDVCPTCNPKVGLNSCDITTSCIYTASQTFMCACRPGFKVKSIPC
jgi:hypothetical protein